MMMDMFHEVISSSGVPVRRMHFNDLMLDLNRTLHRIRQEFGGVADPLALAARQFAAETPVLCFDECHVLNVGEALLMRSFFVHLFSAGATVVATSNLAPDKLYSSGINREVFQPFIDAVLENCDPVYLKSVEDFRASKSEELAVREGDRTFFWPLGASADQRLASSLSALVGDAMCTPAEITVPMGRVLRCRRAWKGAIRVAEFSYEELCVSAVGAHDYIALCDNFDAVVITGVPCFSKGDENAARRFASLVDVLYDRQKRLLCTIDSPPKELFAAIREQYSGGEDDDGAGAAVRMPKHGGSSGKHVAQFRLPQQVQYSESGGYGTNPATKPLSVEDGWVEWSATGLKDASMFDLTCSTKQQLHDRLLPLLRCESRLEEMSYVNGQGLCPSA